LQGNNDHLLIAPRSSNAKAGGWQWLRLISAALAPRGRGFEFQCLQAVFAVLI
jgi:hypothetical protein